MPDIGSSTSGGDVLLEEDLGLLPTQDEVDEYRERGWYVSRPIFSDDELDAAIEGTRRYYAGAGPEPVVPIPASERPSGAYGHELRQHLYANFACPPLDALVRKPILGAIAAALAGVDVIRLWHTQLFYKPPERDGAASRVGWHADSHYWQTCSSSTMLTAWVPLDDMDEEMGPITMIDGSVGWPRHNDVGLSFVDQDLDDGEHRFSNGAEPIRRVVAALCRGQVSFHSMFTLHGSGSNRTARPRRAFAVHLQPGDNQWQWTVRRRGDDEFLAMHALDRLVRTIGPHGVPDYADPQWCPVLHRRA